MKWKVEFDGGRMLGCDVFVLFVVDLMLLGLVVFFVGLF